MNDEVLRWAGHDTKPMAQMKSRKLKYFGHVNIMRHNSLEKDIMLGTMPGKRRQGGKKKKWLDDNTQWSGQSLVDMVRTAWLKTETDINVSFMKSPTLINRVWQTPTFPKKRFWDMILRGTMNF